MKKTNYCVWLKPSMSKIKNKEYFLKRALFFYYNQYPNYNNYSKSEIYHINPVSVFDKCPNIYYYSLYN